MKNPILSIKRSVTGLMTVYVFFIFLLYCIYTFHNIISNNTHNNKVTIKDENQIFKLRVWMALAKVKIIKWWWGVWWHKMIRNMNELYYYCKKKLDVEVFKCLYECFIFIFIFIFSYFAFSFKNYCFEFLFFVSNHVF